MGTSATIKSVTDDPAERDTAVREFFSKLVGVEALSVGVLGEALEEISVPSEAAYPPEPVAPGPVDVNDAESVRRALCALAGLSPTTSTADAARRCRLLWDMHRWLIRAPMSVNEIAARVAAEVPARSAASEDARGCEVEATLVVGAALPEDTRGALRLRAHQLIRGGWQFHRCVDPACGRLYPMGEARCACGHATAPLYVCRNCGADYLRFVGDPNTEPLRPAVGGAEGPEWMVYDHRRLEAVVDDQLENDEDDTASPVRTRGQARQPTQMRQRPVLRGSFDPATLAFSQRDSDYALPAILAPARTQCLCCGGSAGSRNVLTPVALGTSAAVKVVSEGLAEALALANHGRDGHDGKERLLVFSDSRQDAAHQARFIIFASRYDRMRRRVVGLLEREGPMRLQRIVEQLGAEGIARHDTPYAPPDPGAWVSDEALQRVRVWEEAPLLDEISVNAGYRATIVNLGLIGVSYERLGEYVRARGTDLTHRLGINHSALEHICRCLLDEMRTRASLSRELLRYHPKNPTCPAWVHKAEWERRVKQPRGYAASSAGAPLLFLDSTAVPTGITVHNAWRRPGVGGRSPSLERILKHLLDRFGGVAPHPEDMEALLEFLCRGSFLVANPLHGARDSYPLLQVNAETVRLAVVAEHERMHCVVCSTTLAGAPDGSPCPRCHGSLVRWSDADVAANRTVRRIRAADVVLLVAREHTAQIPNDVRLEIEDAFKAGVEHSPINLLACSPTLEMGIDVGGLDAVVLRNVPPRPDNYAQRGGRAGRRSRVGLVVGYARSTPHDQYFYDRPGEMISGEIPAPTLGLGNRDVILRHLNAIAFGAAELGLAGRMVEYVGPQGDIRQEAVDALKGAVLAQVESALALAAQAWGPDVLGEAGLSESALRASLTGLPVRIQEVIDRTARQVIELRAALDRYHAQLLGAQAGTRSGELVARLLGIRTERRRDGIDADDRSAGYPLRRFAEFGILPGYEFPSEPATLRLLGDEHEEDPVTVARRFGIAQFQPDASVFARSKRWKSIGLDTASPWNPRTDGPSWPYRLCGRCKLRYRADRPRCPRCAHDAPGPPFPAFEFGGFLARRDESPILDEEDRFAARNLVKIWPQWDGEVIARWGVGPGWALRWSRREEVQWINEGIPPTPAELQNGVLHLHGDGKGYLLCSTCGRMLTNPPPPTTAAGGRRRPRATAAGPDPYGHGDTCPNRGTPPRPLAIATASTAEVLRLLVPLPAAAGGDELASWGLSLGYALRTGMRQLYMLDGPEIEFELEGPWTVGEGHARHTRAALSFIDPSLGGSGYLQRIAAEFHLVARRALLHLDHHGCERACYRCLKAYQNQRYHDQLAWPRVVADLEALSDRAPETRPLEVGDLDDPRPWLEAYAAGVGSPLELRFLRLFEEQGFHPAKQVPVAACDGEPPISVADFAVPERRLAIYVDSAAFHVGQNLRRDRFIRERLRNGTPPWRVAELRAADLAQGSRLVDRLTNS